MIFDEVVIPVTKCRSPFVQRLEDYHLSSGMDFVKWEEPCMMVSILTAFCSRVAVGA